MYKVKTIKSFETYDWLLNRHYAKRIPNITDAFGLYYESILVGVLTYGIPPSPSLCRGVCGHEFAGDVLELNRLCLLNNKKNEASFFVSKTLTMLKKPKIIVSYADTSMNHVGKVYQSCNFIYTGLSAKHTEWRIIGSNKHSKNICKQVPLSQRLQENSKYQTVDRPQKHRYIYFIGSKKEKKIYKKHLNYSKLSYPKGTSQKYKTESEPKSQMILF
tara:strand:+ start:75 stop:725 length:651 start_codon:yes stop_codon:yes gene_type:complete